MAVFRLSKKAKADLNQITEFYLTNTDEEITVRNLGRIRADIQRLAETPFLGRKIEKLGDQYRFWYALDTTYKVYFYKGTT